jgi:hypothetical protein
LVLEDGSLVRFGDATTAAVAGAGVRTVIKEIMFIEVVEAFHLGFLKLKVHEYGYSSWSDIHI